ncbi:MAG TPA: helix-turn-helix domain-containing protein [Polyangiaceae bacterium]|nr:helix-turn-helix domain-containing protein [Polyangiaceae bacterium]
MPSDRVRRLQLEAELAADHQREDQLQYSRAVSELTSSGERSLEAISVDLLAVQAQIAELEEQRDTLLLAPPEPPRALPSSAAQPAVPEYLDTKQAAALLGVTVKGLEGLRARGKGPPFVRIGRAIRYRRDDLK